VVQIINTSETSVQSFITNHGKMYAF